MSRLPDIDVTSEEQQKIEEAAAAAIYNMGAPTDVYHRDYGMIIRNGQITEEGVRFYNDQKDAIDSNRDLWEESAE